MIVTGKAPNPTKMVSLRIPTTSMRPCALLRRARLATTANSQNISFLPAITSTSTRMHGEFLRLLFLQAHRETTAHFTALGMPAQQHCHSFRSSTVARRSSTVLQWLEEQIGLAAAKAAALRVNLNINGCSIVAPPARPSRPSRACLTDSVLSHSLPMPHVHVCICIVH
jgi:hypothetical protein